MTNQLEIAPISKVISIIDSCINESQIETCKKLAYYYSILAKEKGVVNFEVVKETLDLKIEERVSELDYVESFC